MILKEAEKIMVRGEQKYGNEDFAKLKKHIEKPNVGLDKYENGLSFFELIKYLMWPKTEEVLNTLENILSNCSPDLMNFKTNNKPVELDYNEFVQCFGTLAAEKIYKRDKEIKLKINLLNT